MKAKTLLEAVIRERQLLNLANLAISLNERRSKEEVVDLVQNNMGLAKTIAARYATAIDADFDELISHAREALLRAAERYDEEKAKGVPFIGYAAKIINNELNRLYRREQKYHGNEFTTLDAPMGNDPSGDTAAMNLPDEDSESPEETESRRDMIKLMRELMKKISDERHLRALELYYVDGLNYRKAAKQMSREGFKTVEGKELNHVTVANWVKQGMQELRKLLADKGVTKDHISFESLRESVKRDLRLRSRSR